MKKKILLIILVLIMSTSSGMFAITITPGLAHQNVDLSQGISKYPCLGSHGGNTDDLSLAYGGEHVLARITIDSKEDLGQEITIGFPPDGLNYTYNGSERPYGVELVYKMKLKILGRQYDIISGYKALGSGHAGTIDNTNLSESFTIFSSDMIDDLDEIALKSKYPFIYRIFEGLFEIVDAFDIFGLIDSPGHLMEIVFSFFGADIDLAGIEEAYIDIILVLPELEESEKNQMLYAGDNEYSSTISVTGNGVNEKIPISGNYTDVTERIECSLTVASNGNADAINLNSMDPKNSDALSSLDIGTYVYGIDITSLNQDVGFYAFLSSSSVPDVSGGEFTLSNDNYSFTYEAGISEENGLEGEIKWYDGSDTFSSIQTDESNMFNLGVSDFSTNGATRSFSGDGKILFRLTDKTIENFDSIPPGTYTSTIYFHVVANL